ncbi:MULTISPECIES: hypothetical protein [Vibrio harveyi group]|uniref:hypothetical protein n=1 Tax=Vibrio harveyi group TaxID=717610 RepID=UPI0015F53EC8|nr:hypothetical protein [Vibrio alginolyticus]HDM8060948.1 hypothetical protein [Vibrio harveyi]
MIEEIITLVAELEYIDRSVFSKLDPIVELETNEQKLAYLASCIDDYATQQMEG